MSKISVTIDGRVFEVELSIPIGSAGAELTARVDGEAVQITVPSLEGPEQLEWILVDNRPHELVFDRDLRWVRSHNGQHRLDVRDLETTVARPISGDGRVKAPIPGIITQVLAAPGDQVEAGQPILVLEAMKMENEIRAPRTGTLSQLNVGAGQTVTLHAVMFEIA